MSSLLSVANDTASLEVMLIVFSGQRNFSAFVKPNTGSREAALNAAVEKAWRYCRDTFSARKIRITKIKRRSWAVPNAWDIRGICE
ncbi:MAG TPA: hypothetical protein ENJ26_04000 [Rhodobacteraceae bacterium]|nr:hypothetical protein [Paracoccaceae bacterium]